MNCSVCPHMARIKAALAPCQSCEAGQLHGQISVNDKTVEWATGKSVQPVRTFADAERDEAQHTTVTNLSADDEDALRKAMAALFDLDPIELLLVQHLMHGGSYAGFAAPLLRILRRLRTKEAEMCGKKHGFRSLAQTWAQKVAEKMPMMRPVINDLVDIRC